MKAIAQRRPVMSQRNLALYPLASAATSASVMNGPAAPDAARYRGSQTGRNLFLKLRRP